MWNPIPDFGVREEKWSQLFLFFFVSWYWDQCVPDLVTCVILKRHGIRLKRCSAVVSARETVAMDLKRSVIYGLAAGSWICFVASDQIGSQQDIVESNIVCRCVSVTQWAINYFSNRILIRQTSAKRYIITYFLYVFHFLDSDSSKTFWWLILSAIRPTVNTPLIVQCIFQSVKNIMSQVPRRRLCHLCLLIVDHLSNAATAVDVSCSLAWPADLSGCDSRGQSTALW